MKNVLKGKRTFRNLIHDYLNYNDKQWSKLGIDILLGKPTDNVIKDEQVMFLPDYLLQSFDSATIASMPLVLQKRNVFELNIPKVEVNSSSHPLFIFTGFLLLIVLLSFSKNKTVKRVLVAFDGFIFFITGLLGILLLFMWFGTDHLMCKDNFNLLWAWPTNIVAAFYIHSRKATAKKYFIVYGIFNLVLLICWFFLPQQMNPSLMPIIAILIFRSLLYISKEKYSR
jgi:hypothetical protein